MLAHHARGHDAKYAVVPVAAAGHDAGVAGSEKIGFNPVFDFLGKVALDVLTVAVLLVEAVRQLGGLNRIVAEEQVERFQCGAETARAR